MQAALEGTQASIDFAKVRGDCGRRLAEHFNGPGFVKVNLSGNQ
jgi:hypothetical protein